MNRNQRFVHLISLLAIVVGLFGPILTRPVLAEEPLPDPEITLGTGDGGMSASQDPEESGEIALIPVVPVLPKVTAVACIDGVVFAQAATAAQTEGVTYTIGAPDADGNFVITATLTDASTYVWANSGLDGWTIDGGVGTASGRLDRCPEPEPEIEVPLVPEETRETEPGGEADDPVVIPTRGGGSGKMSTSMMSTSSTDAFSITKTAHPAGTVSPGDEITYTITVTTLVTGTYHMVFTDTLPVGVTYRSHQIAYPGDSCSVTGQVIDCSWNGSHLSLAGWSEIWQITVRVDETFSNGCPDQLLNSVAGNWDGNNTDTATNNVNCPEPELEIEKSDNPGGDPGKTVVPGEEFTYEVRVTNQGTIDVQSYSFTDQIPAGVELLSITNPNADACDPVVGVGVLVSCNGINLQPGDESSQVFTFTVRATAAPTAEMCSDGFTNIATGTWTAGTTSAEVTTQLDCITTFIFNKTGSSPVTPGESVAYEITFENTGNIPINSATITDALPELPDGGTWTVTRDGVPFSFDTPITNLAPDDDPVTIRVESSVIPDTITTDSAWCGDWSNTASVTGSFVNNDPVEDSMTATVRVNCTGFSIDMDVSAPIIEAGGVVTYTITVTNNSSHSIFSLAVFGEMSETNSVFSNWSPSSEDAETCGFINFDNRPHQGCYFLDVSPGQIVEIEITGDAPEVPMFDQCDPVVSTPVGGYRSVVGAQEIQFTGESASTQIDCQPDVEITKIGAVDTGEDDRVDAGDLITYTFEVTNSGNMNLYDIAVTDDLPGLTWQSGTTIDALAPGASESLTATYSVTQADIDIGEVVNTADVIAYTIVEDEPTVDFTMQQEEENTTPTSVSASVTQITELEHAPDVLLVKSSDEDELALNDEITYTFTVTNAGNVTLTDLEVVDDMEGVVFEDGTSIDELAPDEIAELTAMYIVTQADVDAGIIVNCAEVNAIAPDESAVNDDDCATDLIDQHPSLHIIHACQEPASDFLPDVGDEVTFELTISNNGDQTVHDLVLDTSREGALDAELPTSLAPDESATLLWTTIVTEDDYDDREVRVDVTVSGQTGAGFEATLASAVALQQDNSVSTSVTMSCPMADLPVDPATPQPVTKLPETGHGVGTIAPVLLAAAMVSMVALGVGGIGIRRRNP